MSVCYKPGMCLRTFKRRRGNLVLWTKAGHSSLTWGSHWSTRGREDGKTAVHQTRNCPLQHVPRAVWSSVRLYQPSTYYCPCNLNRSLCTGHRAEAPHLVHYRRVALLICMPSACQWVQTAAWQGLISAATVPNFYFNCLHLTSVRLRH